MKMSKKTPEPAWLNADARLATPAQYMPGPWELHITRWPNGEFNGAPYIYAPNGPDTHRHICQPFLDPKASPEIYQQQLANAYLLTAGPKLLEALTEIKTLADAGVIHRNETGKPQWTLTDAVSNIARAAIAKAKGEA